MSALAIWRFVAFARLFAALALLTALVALAGYVVGSQSLIAVGANLRGMSPVTAFCLIALSVSLLATTFGRTWTMRISAFAAALAALLVLLDHALTGSDQISPVIAHALFGRSAEFSGRTSVATALAVILAAAALTTQNLWRLTADVCAATALVIAATALFGYAYNLADLYALPIFATMAVNTAGALFLLSVALLIIEPAPFANMARAPKAMDGEGFLRRSIVIVVPVLADWLLVSGTSASPLGKLVVGLLVLISGSIPISLMILRDSRAFRGLRGTALG